MSYSLLENINNPQDLKALDREKIPALCEEIRAFLIENVERQGGHLASNLGVTELTVALHRIFDSPNDHIIFDVGHQSYVHKILTERRKGFETLRQAGGLSGFTSIKESKYDSFGAGHSSTSISAALGFAEADKLRGRDNYSIAVIGDGAFTGGMAHEALNNCDKDLKLIIILNENGMSISLNKGRFASHLTKVRASSGYISWKSGTKNILSKIPLIGKGITAILTYLKNIIKNLFFSSNYFEDLGLYYIGPVDGNDYKKLEKALKKAKSLGKCVVLHVKTKKGKGYQPAEESPDGFHSLSASAKENHSFHSIAAEKLVKMGKEDGKIIAVTAAMGIGTGLDKFEKEYQERYFDVGIAEEHALTFAAGLAANGEKPFVAIYSTFLQRGYDNIIHDICLQNLPVRILVDRASLALSDGATHHGIFDVAFLSHIPNMTLLSPITYASLNVALDMAKNAMSPIAIRYPNSAQNESVCEIFYPDGEFRELGMRTSFNPEDAPDYLFITYGKIIDKVISASDILKKKGVNVGIVLLERLKPMSDLAERILPYLLKAKKCLFVEEGIKNGGAGMIFEDEFLKLGADVSGKYEIAAIDDNFAPLSESCDLFSSLGLSAEKIASKLFDDTP